MLTSFCVNPSFAYAEQKMDLVYIVTIDDFSSGIAKVKLSVENNNSESLGFSFSDQLGGEVSHIRVLGDETHELEYVWTNSNSFLLDIETEDYSSITIEYEIDTRHPQYNQHVYQGYIGDENTMLKGENVFAFPTHEYKYNLENVKVKFETPIDVKHFVPWDLIDDFYYPNLNMNIKEYDYINNYRRASFAFGNYQSVNKVIGDTKVSVVIPADWSTDKKRSGIFNVFTLVEYFTKLFDDSISDKYMVILTTPAPDGKSIQAGEWSSSQGLGIGYNDFSLERMAHQMFHRWNGFAYGWNWNGDLRELLGEGLNRYYEAKSILNTKNNLYDVTHHNVNYLEYLCKDYSSQKIKFSDLSYVEASDRGGYMVTYNAGAVIWFGLDIQIKNDTDNAYSLDNVIKEFHKASVNKSGDMSKDRFIKTVKEVTGIDYTDYFDQYVFGTGTLNMNSLLEDHDNDQVKDYQLILLDVVE